MNYQGFASYDNSPPNVDDRYDYGSGVQKINSNNMTVQDIFRTPFLFTQEHRKNYKNSVTTALKGIQCNSEISKMFFSDENIKRVQKMIKKEVYNRTKGQFKLEVDQEQRDMLIAMRAVYLEHARFLPGQTVRQVKKLNKRVVDDIVPGMLTEIRQEYGYLKEINKPLTPIPRPMNVNNAGRKTLPSVTTTWSSN